MMHTSKRDLLKYAVGLVGMSLAPSLAWSQLRVEVSGVGANQLPIALPAWRGEESLTHKPSSIIAADLVRSGLFRIVSIPAGMDDTSRPEWSKIRSANADSALLGSVSKLADGRFDVRCRLWDAVRGTELGALSAVSSAADMRLTAHRIADWAQEKLTGERGIAATRIAYVTKSGGASGGALATSTNARFSLWVADADGENAITALTSAEPIISPAWSPNGQQLAYVSFESRKPVVYVHELAAGRRRVVSNFKGSNSAPAWSPDGQQLAVTLTRDGGSQIYLLPSSGGGEPKRLSSSSSVDTEAVFSPDGQHLYFVSDRGGNPQIYKMSLSGGASGGAAQRITFAGNYNISPAISPDGAKLAFISRTNGAFKLMVQELASGTVTTLTDTAADESPSFSANGKHIIYATQTALGGRMQEALMSTTVDGRVKSKLSVAAGDIREPDWGPYFGAPFK